MALKVIVGGRDQLERKALKAIWLGTPEEADYLVNKLQAQQQPDLRLVTSTKKMPLSEKS